MFITMYVCWEQENIIMQEARNLLALRDMTPFSEKQLSAAGLPELYEGTGFGGQYIPVCTRFTTVDFPLLR